MTWYHITGLTDFHNESPEELAAQIQQYGLQGNEGVYLWDNWENVEKHLYSNSVTPNMTGECLVWQVELTPEQEATLQSDPWFEGQDYGMFAPGASPEEAAEWSRGGQGHGAWVLPAGYIAPNQIKLLTVHRPKTSKIAMPYQTKQIPFERLAAFILQSQWADVMAKAKRLIMQNKVTILNNTPESVIAHVIGDTGEHDVEIAREDSDSGVLTQTVCDCPWNQYRFDRTRPYKALEGRPCSHILAAYWKAKSTPIDSEAVPFDYAAPVGQRPPAVAPGQQTLPIPKELGAEPGDVQAPLPSTQQIVTPPPPENPFQAPQGAEGESGPMPVKIPQREQLRLFDVAPMPGGKPPEGPAPTFSVPGGTPPSPANIQLPGTFSSLQWKTSTTTRTKLLEEKARWDAVLPDKGTVHHTFPNGWHIYEPITQYDAAREGTLMENCTSDAGAPGVQQEFREFQTGTPEPDSVNQNWSFKPWNFDQPQRDDENWAMMTLRDPDGIPHAMWSHWFDEPLTHGAQSLDAEGRRGQPLKPEYIDMLRQYYNPQGDPEEWSDRYAKIHTAMAERSGDPELDQAIAEFSQHQLMDYVGPRFPAQELRRPEVANGMCSHIADQLEYFLEQRGFKAYRTPESEIAFNLDIPNVRGDKAWFKEDPSPEDFGYDDATIDPGCDQHHWVIVETATGTFGVDFTASQFGYSEFPMVQKLDEGGGWSREWTKEIMSAKLHKMGASGWYHGTVYKRFAPGEYVVPGNESGTWANWTVFEDLTKRPLETGEVVHPQDVVWVTNDPTDAASWAEHSIMKSTQAEIRLHSPAGGIAVYEVEPEGLDYPTERHSDGEAVCRRARVIREVSFEPFDMNTCDACGEIATVGMGTENQLCDQCAQEEAQLPS